MNLTIWLSFVGASIVFCLIPGPSVCFTIACALRHGARTTLFTIGGQLAADCCEIIVVLFGIAKLLERSALFFHGLKIIGAVYLIYLGYRQWTADKPHLNVQKGRDSKTARKAFIEGFAVCGTNPKTLLYYAALLPQFVRPTYSENIQLIILASTSIVVAGLVLAFYTILADSMSYWLTSKRYWKTQNRVTGLLMMGTSVVLSIVS